MTSVFSAPNSIANGIRVRVAARNQVADDVDEFVLVSDADVPLPSWSAGSHVDLATPAGPVRQYSLCPQRAHAGEEPGDEHTYRIAVQRRADGRGGSVSAHASLTVGTPTWISPPRNHFALTRALTYVFVAGGIGITPLLSLVEAARTSGRPWKLIYTGPTRGGMAYTDELVALHGAHVSIRESRRTGRVDFGDELAGLPRGTAVYACGPAGMLDAVVDACADQPAVDVFTERFTAPVLSGRPAQSFELSLALSGVTVDVPEDRTILDVLDACGVVAPSSCREGTCGTCETGVVSGEVDHRDVILSPEERAENESMMICVSRCSSGRLVLEL